jgi:hypothetical protein
MTLAVDPQSNGLPPQVSVQVTKTIVVYRKSRALDWVCAAMILAWGITLAAPGNAMAQSPVYRIFLEKFPEPVWAFILCAIGVARLLALIINGHAPRGSPVLRGGAAFLGVIVWGHFLGGFLDVSIRNGTLSGGVGLNIVMLGAEIFSIGRATADAMRARTHVHRG